MQIKLYLQLSAFNLPPSHFSDLMYQGKGGWSEIFGHQAPYGGVEIRLHILRERCLERQTLISKSVIEGCGQIQNDPGNYGRIIKFDT